MTQTPTSWTSTGPKAKPIVAGEQHLVARLAAKMFDKAYATLTFPAGTANKYAMPGLVLALNSVTKKYVPWVTDARYGAGSDTSVGILIEQLNLSDWDRMCSPMYHGEVVEGNIYQADDDIGTVDSTVKTDLPDIEWK